LMDVVDIPAIGKSFRMVPHRGGLFPIEVSPKEKNLKIVVVRNKKTLKDAKIACACHDGRVFLPAGELDINQGDSCLLKVPRQEFQASFRLGKGGLALLIMGERSGEVVTVEDLKPGTFARGAISTIRFRDGTSSELPTRMLMPLGRQVPNLTLSVSPQVMA
jgi:ribosomal protein S4E